MFLFLVENDLDVEFLGNSTDVFEFIGILAYIIPIPNIRQGCSKMGHIERVPKLANRI